MIYSLKEIAQVQEKGGNKSAKTQKCLIVTVWSLAGKKKKKNCIMFVVEGLIMAHTAGGSRWFFWTVSCISLHFNAFERLDSLFERSDVQTVPIRLCDSECKIFKTFPTADRWLSRSQSLDAILFTLYMACILKRLNVFHRWVDQTQSPSQTPRDYQPSLQLPISDKPPVRKSAVLPNSK